MTTRILQDASSPWRAAAPVCHCLGALFCALLRQLDSTWVQARQVSLVKEHISCCAVQASVSEAVQPEGHRPLLMTATLIKPRCHRPHRRFVLFGSCAANTVVHCCELQLPGGLCSQHCLLLNHHAAVQHAAGLGEPFRHAGDGKQDVVCGVQTSSLHGPPPVCVTKLP